MTSKVKQLIEQARAAITNPNSLTAAQRSELTQSLQAAIDGADGSPWWVVLLKVLAYAIGLILAGYGTTAAAATLLHF